MIVMPTEASGLPLAKRRHRGAAATRSFFATIPPLRGRAKGAAASVGMTLI